MTPLVSVPVLDGILVLVALECALLIIVRTKLRPPVSTVGIVAALGAGAALMAAVRAALVGAAWPVLAGWLGVSLVAHLTDLYLRGWWPGRASASVRRADD